MTSAEMLVYLKERYSLSSHSNMGKQNDELYLSLNAAVGFFINTRFTGNNSRQTNLTNDQKRYDDIRTLLVKSDNLSPGGTPAYYTNSKAFALPNDYRFLVNAFSKIDNEFYPCDIINQIQASEFAKTKYNLPQIEKPKAFAHNGGLTILYDYRSDLNTAVAVIDYIKAPAKISDATNCDLPVHTHEEICELATLLLTEGSENLARFQSGELIIDKKVE